MKSLLETLVQRDGLSVADALREIDRAYNRVAEGDDPEDVLQEEFGLEPDYVFDLLAAVIPRVQGQRRR